MVVDACRSISDTCSFKENNKHINLNTMMKNMDDTKTSKKGGEFLLMYSCEPQTVAYDGLFTPYLCKQLFTEKNTLAASFDNVSKFVQNKTNHKQKPMIAITNFGIANLKLAS